MYYFSIDEFNLKPVCRVFVPYIPPRASVIHTSVSRLARMSGEMVHKE